VARGISKGSSVEPLLRRLRPVRVADQVRPR
jgi:hypothetical protein